MTMALNFLLFHAVVCLAFLFSQAVEKDFFKPTPNLKQEFNRRCLEYFDKFRHLNYVDEPPAAGPPTKAYCGETWDAFREAFAFKDACSVTQEDYKKFLTKSGTSKIQDRLTFWSKTQELSLKLSMHSGSKKAAVLADTLPGYLATDLIWCGDPNGKDPDGILYSTSCPKCKAEQKKNHEHLEIFWAAASTEFAKRASGVVRHLVNGTVGTEAPNCAHHCGTFFARYELKNIIPSEVTEFRVIVASEPKKNIYETCTSGTIKTLLEEIKDKIKKEPKCITNPKGVLEIFCKDPELAGVAECTKASIDAANPF